MESSYLSELRVHVRQVADREREIVDVVHRRPPDELKLRAERLITPARSSSLSSRDGHLLQASAHEALYVELLAAGLLVGVDLKTDREIQYQAEAIDRVGGCDFVQMG